MTTWNSRAWLSSSHVFSSLVINKDYSYVHSSHNILNLVRFLLEQIPWMNDSHDLGRSFNVVVTTSASSKLSPIASSLFLNLRDPCEVRLNSFWHLHLHTLNLGPLWSRKYFSSLWPSSYCAFLCLHLPLDLQLLHWECFN